MTKEKVSVDTFVRAETNRMFAGLTGALGVNSWRHTLQPVPIDHQPVIRMNRDTLYSSAIIDLAEGATLTIPEHGDRYVSVMVVNQDHYINDILHEPGEHRLTVDQFDTRYVAVAARVLVDPDDAADIAAANEIQHQLVIEAGSAEPFVLPEYDQESFDGVRRAVLDLGKFVDGGGRSFGRREDVDPIRHLIGTAIGWGGLPEREAMYTAVFPDDGEGDYVLTVGDVPVDAFWSISVYNADGFFEANSRNVYSVNSITAHREADGAIEIHLATDGDHPNVIPTPPGWNAVVRMYQPRAEVRDGTWTFPKPVKH
jgi:hypothetical protein